MTTKGVDAATGEVVSITGVHPLADTWPRASEANLRDLADDIRINGQRYPIELTPDGRVAAGRHRLAACELAELDPEVTVRADLDTDDKVRALVLSENRHRQHLSVPQLAAATALTLGKANRQNGRWRRGSIPDNPGSGDKSWTERMREAGLILDWLGEATLREVASGDTALDAAYRKAYNLREQAGRVDALGGDLAALVRAGTIDLDEAERRADEEQRLAKLPDDLVERVRDNNVTLAEAEQVDRERRDRIQAWANRLRDALGLLARMVGNPTPDDLADQLSEPEHLLLEALKVHMERDLDRGVVETVQAQN